MKGFKRAITVLVVLALIVPVALLGGCGPGEAGQASGYKKAGDRFVLEMESQHADVETALYKVGESYSGVVGEQEPGDLTLYPAFQTDAKEIQSTIESARDEYGKILRLEGAANYKAYAREMLACLQDVSASVAYASAMADKQNQMMSAFAQSGQAPDLEIPINDDREKKLSCMEESSRHFNAAYQVDKDYLHGSVPGKGRQPVHARVSWQVDPAREATVTWETGKWLRGYSAGVRYGRSPDSTDGTAAGSSFLHHYGSREEHQARIPTPSPDTVYYYRCGSEGFGWSDVRTFRTPPARGEGFTFCVAGDTRSASPDSTDVTEWGKVASAADGTEPLFTIINGDLVFLGFEDRLWPSWLEAAEPLTDSGVMMPCLGNHESYAMGFFDRFALPGNERWYSYDVSDVHFVCLDTGLMNYAEGPLLDEQVGWLTGDLEQAKKRGSRWTVVYTHRSPYSSGDLGDQQDIISSWVPVFDRFGVDLVIPSHVHYYERSFPMKGGQVVDTSTDRYASPGGTIYLITGCGGAPLGDPAPAPWIATLARQYCYTSIEVGGGAGGALSVETRTPDGTVLDRFTVSK
ncbi:MAG: metallophosphoesterase family protein [Actinobacteria bacterium]|nr:metallophosphoesterase family protein [Actinomycetota bacterium]MBU1943986.1 metallophosphoesterase family protein [Actinomycetota bacterium]MBU2688482.1 metallophosphoesterase family protein [Actinomycetota bacterium]